MSQLASQCRDVLALYVAGFVESCGLVYEDTSTPASGKRLALSGVRWAPLWAYIPRDPALWERLHKFTMFSVGLSILLLLAQLLLPLRLLGAVAGAVPLYVVLPVLGLVWYPKVFTEGRCLRRGQYHVNTSSARRQTADTTTAAIITAPSSGWRCLPGLFWHMLTQELPPTAEARWVRGDAALPVRYAAPITGPTPSSPDSASSAPTATTTTTTTIPSSDCAQSTYQQTDKNAALLLFSVFILLVEWFVPIRAVATGCGMFLNALLYAFYVFDYRYVQDGATAAQQVADFDAHTAYYCGYGSLSVLCLYGVSWLTGNAMAGASLNFGLYGWHVAFSDYAHRWRHRSDAPQGSSSMPLYAFAALDTPRSADETPSSPPPSSSGRGPQVLTRWFAAVRWFIAHVALAWRCALLFAFVTMIAALY